MRCRSKPRNELLTCVEASTGAGFKRTSRAYLAAGMTLIEVLVAAAVFGIAVVGLMSGISYMRFENRSASQRMFVASAGAELIELFKALPYDSIHNSTVGTPIYLKGFGSASPNTAWIVPQTGQWTALPVEDVNSSSASNPAIIPDRLPQGIWSVAFVPDPADANITQINVQIQWRLFAGTTRPPSSYGLSTIVCRDFPNL